MPNQQGFTLLELLITLAIIAILMSLGAFNLQSFFIKNQQITAVNQLLDALSFARHNAITRHVAVSLCPTLNNQHCDKEWRQGYMVFINQLNDIEPNPTHILAIYPNKTASIEINNSREIITFQPSGQSPNSNSTFIISAPNSNESIVTKLILNTKGRIAVEYVE